MDLQQMLSNIDNMGNSMLDETNEYYKNLPPEETPGAKPVDLYQKKSDARREESKKARPNGSSSLVMATLKAILTGDGVPATSLVNAYREAKSTVDMLKSNGEKDRAEIARQQYMNERFIPAIEVVVNYTSPDELLNSSRALSELDKYALVVGKANGYTASYVRRAYENALGQRMVGSDDTVLSAVREIKNAASCDRIRDAVGTAKRIKKQIDDGEHIADEADYALIGRVAAYGC